MKRVDTTVQRLPPGRHLAAVVVAGIGAHKRTFVQVDGKVYTANGGSIDLARDFGSNDAERRAWCQLTGTHLADLKGEMAAAKIAQAQRDEKGELAAFKRKAERLGYRIVKTKAAK